MDTIGETSLLNLSLIAFFASRSVSEECVERALRWVHDVVRDDRVVVGGFHSPLEKEILSVLMSAGGRAVMVLGRRLYTRLPERYSNPVSEGRLLITTVRDYPRHSSSSAQIRNWIVADMADELVFAGAENGSALNVLCELHKQIGEKPVLCL